MRGLFTGLFLLLVLGVALAQSGRTYPRTGGSEPPAKRNPSPEVRATPDPTPEEPDLSGVEDDELVRVETQLVTVPVVVRDRADHYIPDMRQEEFTLDEDGARQEIAFFSKTDEPFHLVLLLDTSSSTQDKLRPIQNAAISFTTQLQPADRVKVISFDEQIRPLCEFTADRAELQRAIARTRPGQGTRLYDAMRQAVAALWKIKGRKAIVIFTDGVDSYSDKETFDKNIRLLEEAGIIVYPIRFDTRADIEEQIRRQKQGGGLIDLGTILGGGRPRAPGGTTPPPGGTQIPRTPPNNPGGVTIGIPGLPGGITLPRRRNDPNDPRNPRYPDPNDPRNPDPNDPNSPRYPNPNDPNRRRNDGLTDLERAELDNFYRTADAYLGALANTTGGSLYRADYLGQLPAAFGQIAAELRTQYAVSYYPTNKTRDGKFRKIKVKTTRQNVALRARPGYRAPLERK